MTSVRVIGAAVAAVLLGAGCTSAPSRDAGARCPASQVDCEERLASTGRKSGGDTEDANVTETRRDTPRPNSSSNDDTCDLGIANVNVLDVQDKIVLRNVDVSIAQGVISKIEPHQQNLQCRELIDGENKFLMPGLVDMHTHADAIFLPRPGQYERITNAVPLSLRQAGKMLLTAGVTAFLDLCSAPQDEIFGMRDQQRQGGLTFNMPDIYAAGTCVSSQWYNRKGDPAQFNHEAEIADVTLLEKVDDYPKAYPTKADGSDVIYGWEVHEKASEMAKIEALLAKNPDVIKVFYTRSWDEGAHYPSLHLDTIREIERRAHARGIRVFAHAITREEQYDVLKTDIDGLAHGAWDYLDRRGFRNFHPASPVVVVPTVTVLAALGKLVDFDKVERELTDPLLLKVLSSVNMKSRVLEAWRNMKPYTKRRMDWVQGGFGMKYEYQVPHNMKLYTSDPRFEVLAGDDASNLGVFLGFGMHQELDSMVSDLGMPAWDALASATIRPGKFFHKRYGTKVGDIANLILLRNSPLKNIKNTRNIEKVILHGKAL